MKKISILGLAAMMIVAVSVSSAYALKAPYNVMPKRGPADQPILIWVRTDPIVTDEPITILVFWDNVLVKGPISEKAMKNGNYEHSWDITLEIPANMAQEGDHRIQIWLEEKNGHVTELNYQYTITDGIPSIKMWERFLEENPDFLEKIIGPQGEMGQEGIQGPRGNIGREGQVGPEGPIGEKGPQGVRGWTGMDGEPGRLGWVYLIGLLLVNCTIVVVATWIIEAKRK